ncbi:S26 family signal peptidase [Streptosporangiaceae bacterium NEAU-GS5]|nr:S26 family signal peptidase [Streptosporangiaceae bacterium NEAU-GS5]
MILLVVSALAVIAGLAVRRLRRRWLTVTVRGESMRPALLDGDAVLVRRCGLGDVSVGDIVVFHAPRGHDEWVAAPATPEEAIRPLLVKRVAAVNPGSLYVLGDNGGQDSRAFGDLPAGQLVGVVSRRIPRR